MRAPGKFLASVAAVAFSAAPALAADAPVKAPVVKAASPTHDWTGWYGGYNVGVGVSRATGSIDVDPGFFDRSGAGFAGGVQGGLNWQANRHWLGGIEADLGFLNADRSFRQFANSLTFGVKSNWYGTIRGRLGFTSGPSLFYATGGVAFVNVKNNQDFSDVPASTTETAGGWTLGGGIETVLGGNWSAKAEYLYIDAGTQDVVNPDLPVTASFENRFHVFRYGLNFKFGGPNAPADALPAHNWTGFYAGLNAGAGLSQVQSTTPDAGGVFIGAVDIANSSLTGGVQAGYNWRFNRNWVAGIEGDVNRLEIERTLFGPDAQLGFGVKTDWYATLRGRLGHSTGPALLYVTGGAAFVNVTNDFNNNGVDDGFVSRSKAATGWTVGGGIEAVLSRNWTAKTEYLYIDAGNQDVFNPVGGNNLTARFDNRFHVFRFGLNYRFGG